MYKNKTIGVVVPAYNVQNLIGRVIETIPDFVDKIIIIDDCSKDNTINIIKEHQSRNDHNKIILITHHENQGVGGAIISGYKYAREQKIDVTAVMAGDAQMDPDELESIVEPVVSGRIDYTKGNRLFTGQSWRIIPKSRYFGNAILSLLTKIVSGYWSLADFQSGYTAISLKYLKLLSLDDIYKRYGFPNDILVRLNVLDARVCDVFIKPVYNVGEKSGIKLRRVIPTISFLLVRLFFWRLKEKYIIRDFHPLVLFYFGGMFLFIIGLILAAIFIYKFFAHNFISVPSIVISSFCIISSFQMTLFAMWFDMDNNRKISL